MIKAIGAALLAAGLILLYFGYQASQSFGSEVKEALTGSPTEQAMWYLVGGAACAVFGLVALVVGGRR